MSIVVVSVVVALLVLLLVYALARGARDRLNGALSSATLARPVAVAQAEQRESARPSARFDLDAG